MNENHHISRTALFYENYFKSRKISTEKARYKY